MYDDFFVQIKPLGVASFVDLRAVADRSCAFRQTVVWGSFLRAANASD